MSKLKKAMIAFVALSLSMVVAARTNAEGTGGCKTGKFVGSYTHTDTFADIWGDGVRNRPRVHLAAQPER